MSEAKDYIDSFNRVLFVEGSAPVSTTSSTDVLAEGLSISPGAGSYLVKLNSQYKVLSGNVTAQAVTDLNFIYNTLMAVAATSIIHAPAFGLGETLSPGVYVIAGAGSLAGSITLDAGGNANAVFIFRFGAAFNTSASATIILANGASAANIFWIAEGAIGIGASNVFKGTIISNTGAVSLGATCNFLGRMFARNGAIGIDGPIVAMPAYSAYINLGVLSTFAMFSSIGNVTNAGASNITGSIGTNSGTITGFGTATVNGAIYLPGVDNNSIATFSIYQNGVLIPSSVRVRVLNINTVDLALEAIATVALGQAIEVRYKVDAGTVTLTNRILTVKRIS